MGDIPCIAHFVSKWHTGVTFGYHIITGPIPCFGAVVYGHRCVNQTGKDMSIRIPLWVPPDTINLTADARPVKPDFRDGFAFVPRGGDRQQVELRYGLPTCCDEEDWRDEDATQESVSLTWRGDEVLSVDVGGPYLSPHLKVCRRL